MASLVLHASLSSKCSNRCRTQNCLWLDSRDKGLALSNQDRMLIERLFAENLWCCCAGICNKLLCFRGDQIFCESCTKSAIQQTSLPLDSPTFEQFSAGISGHWHLWDCGYTSDFCPLILRQNAFSIINCMADTSKFYCNIDACSLCEHTVWRADLFLFFHEECFAEL